MIETSKVRLGIIGLGNMGSTHARTIRAGKVPGLVLAAAADVVRSRLDPFFGVLPFEDPLELIHSGTVDAVLIATPHFSHTELGIAALKAGLHVLVEKPIAVHKQDALRLLAAHEGRGRQIFGVMLNQRTDPRYQKLKALIQDGELGQLQRINWIITDWYRTDRYYRLSDWRATWAGEGGGVLLNQCPHQLDLWQWLFGLPQRVYARCQFGRYHDIEVEDSVTAILEYDSGMQGVFVTSTGEAPGTNRLEVVGENGRVVIEDTGPLRFTRNESSSVHFARTHTQPFDKPAVWNVEIPCMGPGSQHTGILINFTQAVEGREPLIAPAAEGLPSIELANAMILSSIQNAAVPLPLDAPRYARTLNKLMVRSRYKPHAPREEAGVADLSQSC